MGEIVSFYSYKGGVGRSMALANIAVLSAQRDLRVLAVDFDLDAPGLHRYFLDRNEAASTSPPHEAHAGLIDLFVELRESATAGEDVSSAQIASLLTSGRFVRRVSVRAPNSARLHSLDFMPAGRFDDHYAGRVHDFPWAAFYEEHGVVFERLAEEWRRTYQYVFIDSRSGISDLGSVSTVILPDKLVLAFTPNQQSLHGAVELGRQAVRLKRELDPSRPLMLFPLLTRVDEGEEALRRWIGLTAQRFTELFESLYGSCTIDFAAYFNAVRLPHRGYYAYGEKIAAEEESAASLGSLAEGYSRFLDCLEGESLDGWESRIRNVVRPRVRRTALLVGLDSEFDPPPELEFDEVVRAPPELPERLSSRLRSLPTDSAAWELALDAIDRGVQAAMRRHSGEVHVFTMAPYPAAVYLGRRLDDLGRARILCIHQFDAESRTWFQLRTKEPEPPSPIKPYFAPLQVLNDAPTKSAALLAVEGMQPISTEALVSLAEGLDAVVFRLSSTRTRRFIGEQAPGAVSAIRDALTRIHAGPPRSLHIVTTVPVALALELGRALSPTVHAGAVVHQYAAAHRTYVPVLDVLRARGDAQLTRLDQGRPIA